MEIPKKKRIALKGDAYTKFKAGLWEDAYRRCQVCNFYLPPEYVQLHHKKTRGAGGGDTKENCMVVCFKCHCKIHTGEVKV